MALAVSRQRLEDLKQPALLLSGSWLGSDSEQASVHTSSHCMMEWKLWEEVLRQWSWTCIRAWTPGEAKGCPKLEKGPKSGCQTLCYLNLIICSLTLCKAQVAPLGLLGSVPAIEQVQSWGSLCRAPWFERGLSIQSQPWSPPLSLRPTLPSSPPSGPTNPHSVLLLTSPRPPQKASPPANSLLHSVIFWSLTHSLRHRPQCRGTLGLILLALDCLVALLWHLIPAVWVYH